MKIAILALQGAFIEHENILKKLGVDFLEIRQKKDALEDFDGLIIPGGESTTQGKLLHEFDIFDVLKEKIIKGLPVFGTCAGLILLAKEIENDDRVHFSTMDIIVKRNAYGRQLASFITNDKFNDKLVPMVFIRAPYISKVTKDCEVLAVVDGKIVAARENNQLVCAFHPELTSDYTVHKYFLSIVENYLNSNTK
ncbi:MAG: pyridoxal 5'-phosphate synthase glutaminase subunit PdxT [Erysipelotrichaceae bacterium]|nr:pyridoxal 5'-phosphate synthase glutaminase subunit PdxT [Erysipelotrichaceae bacterium]